MMIKAAALLSGLIRKADKRETVRLVNYHGLCVTGGIGGYGFLLVFLASYDHITTASLVIILGDLDNCMQIEGVP